MDENTHPEHESAGAVSPEETAELARLAALEAADHLTDEQKERMKLLRFRSELVRGPCVMIHLPPARLWCVITALHLSLAAAGDELPDDTRETMQAMVQGFHHAFRAQPFLYGILQENYAEAIETMNESIRLSKQLSQSGGTDHPAGGARS